MEDSEQEADKGLELWWTKGDSVSELKSYS